MSKEFKMGFIEEVEPLKLTTIHKKYQKLIEATENRWFNKMKKLAKICQKRIDDLETKLAEKDELLKQKIGDMKSTDFIRMCKECGFMVQAKEIDKEFLKAISRQVTDNVPKLYIQDVESGTVFEYGGNCHDRLLISEDGRSLTYYNLQNGDGSCVGDYRFYYEKPEDETDFDADEWARMVKHQSITELLAEERKKVVQEIREKVEQAKLIYEWKGNEIHIEDILDQIERGKL